MIQTASAPQDKQARTVLCKAMNARSVVERRRLFGELLEMDVSNVNDRSVLRAIANVAEGRKGLEALAKLPRDEDLKYVATGAAAHVVRVEAIEMLLRLLRQGKLTDCGALLTLISNDVKVHTDETVSLKPLVSTQDRMLAIKTLSDLGERDQLRIVAGDLTGIPTIRMAAANELRNRFREKGAMDLAIKTPEPELQIDWKRTGLVVAVTRIFIH